MQQATKTKTSSSAKNIMIAALVAAFGLISCTGKVANVAEGKFGATASLQIVTSKLSEIQVGSVSSSLVVVGGTPPLNFKVSAGSLPKGLKLDASSGAITGVIAKSLLKQKYKFDITVSDSVGDSATASYAGVVGAGANVLSNKTDKIADFVAGLSYSYPMVVVGGLEPYKFAVSEGVLPDGVVIDADSGYLSGSLPAPTANKSYSFKISVRDYAGEQIESSYVGVIKSSAASAFAIMTADLPAMSAGVSYGASIGVIGGTAPFTFSTSALDLPSGLSLNPSTGLLSGVPDFAEAGQPFLFTVTVTDSKQLSTTMTYTGSVSNYTIGMGPNSFPNARPGSFYSAVVFAVGGQGPYTYVHKSGVLPIGLIFNAAAGSITGYVDEAEASSNRSFTISATDVNGITIDKTFSIATSPFEVTVVTSSLADAFEGDIFNNGNVALSASGGIGPHSFEYIGSLPSGVALTSSGVFFGKPAVGEGQPGAGKTFPMTVRARDSQGIRSGAVNLSLKVKISPVTLSAHSPDKAVIGAPYEFQLLATGGRGPYEFVKTLGSFPVGLTMNASGKISGAASTATTCPAGEFTIVAIDAFQQTSSPVNLCIATTTGVTITNTSFPPIIVGSTYSATIGKKGGTSPYTFSAIDLPVGISLNPSTGVLSGFTGAGVGDYETTFTVYDGSDPQQFQSLTYTLRVRDPLNFSTVTLPRAGTGLPYNGGGYQFLATGGKMPYVFTITSGSLPSGLSISSSGILSGTPAYNTAAFGGSYSFALSVTDADGQVRGPVGFNLYVTVPPKIVGTRMPIAVVGNPYAYDVQRSGGVNEILSASDNTSRLNYTVSGLPDGLLFGAKTGRIYGTPTTNVGSPYTVTVTLTDQHGFATTKNLIFQVNAAAKVLDLRAGRNSDPCSGLSNCYPQAHDIAPLTSNAQQFFVYVRNDVTPRAIQIAKIDPSGRVPYLDANATSRRYNLTSSITATISSINHIRAVDVDNDGLRDIAFIDGSSRLFCVMWNPGTVDSVGMPNFTSTTTGMNCFPVPMGNSTGNYPYGFVVRDDLRPDATNYGKKDVVIAVSQSASPSHFVVLKNKCLSSCTAQRATIFDGYTNTAVASIAGNTINFGSAAGFENIATGSYVYGNGISPLTTISSRTATSITLSSTPSGTTSVTAVTSIPYTTTAFAAGASTITGLSPAAAASMVGQMLHSTAVNAGTIITAVNTGTNTITLSRPTTGAGSGIIVYGPTAHMPVLTTAGNAFMRDTYYPAVGWFVGAKPNFSSGTRATATDHCPGIAVSGFNASNTANGYVYVARQTYSGGQCQGDFQTHTNADEWLASGGTPWLGQLAAEDFNGDQRTDVAVTATNAVNASSANVRVYLTNLGAAFTGGTAISPQLQSRGTLTTGANKIAAYCPDGSNSCSFPSLIVTCGGNTTNGCLSVIPNQCASTPCSTPFEAGTPTKRIDYPAPPGNAAPNIGNQGGQDIMIRPIVSTSFATITGTISSSTNPNQITGVSSTVGVQVGQPIYITTNYTYGNGIPNFAYVTAVSGSTITMNSNATQSGLRTLYIPIAPTLNDVALAGTDASGGSNNNTFLLVYGKNGSSASDPLKGAAMLDSYPNSFLQGAEMGYTKVIDANGDGRPDLFAYAHNQGFVGSYMGAGGTRAFGISTWPASNYLSSPSAGGCPTGEAFCFPDPIFNSMGVQQQTPTGWQFDDATMDMADLDNDGMADIAVTGFFSRGIAVSLGTFSGDFKPPVLYPIGTNADYRPRSVKLSDLDQDGFIDMVAIGTNSSVSNTTGFAVWFKNNGDGTFATPVFINQIMSTTATCNDPSPRSVSAIDIDLDGRPELAVLCYTNQSVWVSRRNALGTWMLQTGNSINVTSPGINGWSMKWGRMVTNSATGMDMVVTGIDNTSTVRVVRNINISNITVNGDFQISGTPSSYVALYGAPAGVDIGDFNGDGLVDYTVGLQRTLGTSYWGNTYVTCIVDTSGNCSPQGWGNEGTTTTSVTTADTNDDGLPELFVGYWGTGRLIYRTLAAVFNVSQ